MLTKQRNRYRRLRAEKVASPRSKKREASVVFSYATGAKQMLAFYPGSATRASPEDHSKFRRPLTFQNFADFFW